MFCRTSYSYCSICLIVFTFLVPEFAQAESREGEERVSPARQVEHDQNRARRSDAPAIVDGPSQIDGSANNVDQPFWGASFIPLLRRFEADYSDGESSLAGESRASARQISNLVFAQAADRVNTLGATDFLWQWGQFLDHDIDLTEGTDPAEPAPIVVPVDDLYFYPDSEIAFNRSHYDKSESGVRQQINEITAWIDASNVYGSSEERLIELREEGTGRLKTSEGNLLPFNTAGISNAGGSDATLFLAGDIRANEQVGLLAMHTIFVREHNRYVDRLSERSPELSSDELFARGRQWVAALMQVITYREFLPALLGRGAMTSYSGYNPEVNGSIMNAFSTAAYRFGHSALSPTLLRLDAEGNEIEDGHLALRHAFFSPSLLDSEDSIDPILRGLAAQACQKIDALVIDDVRNFLFGTPPSAGFDLVSLNIQRGRDHGLPSYNAVRLELGLPAVEDFADISSDPEVVARLETAYSSAADVDLWVGGLSEDALPGSHLGETFSTIILEQFTALRDGDRFWYERTLRGDELTRVERTRLSDVIRRNTSIGDELPHNVFSLNERERQPRPEQQRPR